MLINIFSRIAQFVKSLSGYHLPVKIMTAVIFLIVFICADANASLFNVVSVQSSDIKPYNDAVRGYEDTCKCEIKKLILSEFQGDIVYKVRSSKPDIIIAVGANAVKSILEIKDIPIIHLMTAGQEALLKDRKNIVGIEMLIPPEIQLLAIKKTLPHVSTVGIIYGSAETESFVKRAVTMSKASGISIVAQKLNNIKEFPSVLDRMRSSIDAYLMLPEMSTISPETNEYTFLFSVENNVPVITFSKKYLKMGALVSFDVDAYNIGRQAWELSDRILVCTDISSLSKVYAEKFDIALNNTTARIFGVVPIGKKLIKALAVNEKSPAF